MNKSKRLKMIERIAKKVAQERRATSDLVKSSSVYMNSVEINNTIESSGVLDTYEAMKGYDQWQ